MTSKILIGTSLALVAQGPLEKYRLDKGEHMFETQTRYNLASAILNDLQQPEIGGKSAQENCRFLALKCFFSNSLFDGYYQLDSGKTFVNHDYKGILYRFDVSDEGNITFMMNDSQESLNLSENTTLDDEFKILVKTGYDYYQLGSKIAVSWMVGDVHPMSSQTIFEHPVNIQIITNGKLINVTQLEIRKDGQFQHIVNTMTMLGNLENMKLKPLVIFTLQPQHLIWMRSLVIY